MKRIAVIFFFAAFSARISCQGMDKEYAATYECCVVPPVPATAVSEVSKEVYEVEPVIVDAADTWIPEAYQGYCREIGGMYNICPELLMAMVEKESGGDAAVSNGTGDAGLLQVNPKWHHERMEKLGVTDLYDPYSNILVAADYLAELFEQEEDLYLVLMKYNMDHGAAEKLHGQGIYSRYAIEVSERAWELERLHEKERGTGMNRRITIEMDTEDPGNLVKDILDMVAVRMDANVEFSIKQEMLPEKIRHKEDGIQIPAFLQKGSSMDG